MCGFAVMGMPETPMNKNYLAPRAKHEIGFARKIFAMQPEPVPQLVDKPPHPQFGLHIFAPDRPHIRATVHQWRSREKFLIPSVSRERSRGFQNQNIHFVLGMSSFWKALRNGFLLFQMGADLQRYCFGHQDRNRVPHLLVLRDARPKKLVRIRK